MSKIRGVSIAGLDAGELKAMRRRVQIIFQDPYESLNPYMTIREILEEPFRIHGEYRREGTTARIEELMALVGLASGALNRTQPSSAADSSKSRNCSCPQLRSRPPRR